MTKLLVGQLYLVIKPTMARPSNTEQRRRQIVAALADLMTKKGYSGATIVEIARSAGLAPGLVHYHFSDKHEILIALCGEVAATIQRRYRSRTADVSTSSERISAFIDAHVALGEDADASAVAAWSAVGAEALHDSGVRAVYRQHIEREMAELGKLFTGALQDQGRRVHEVASKSAMVLAAIEGSYRIATASPGTLPRGFSARGIRKLAEWLVAAEPRIRR
jgi:TetR/AcrR family transcriptional repressor of bet genes